MTDREKLHSRTRLSANILSRREFLATLTAGLAAGSHLIAGNQKSSPAGIPTRPLGKTGEHVSIIGLGGYTIGRADRVEAVKMMHYAIDEGVTFLDNCWDYNKGWSEEVMGQAIASGSRRDKVFLMTKTCGRDAANSLQQLEDSLQRLKTDHIDLWMFHGISRESDAQRIFAGEGAIKTALEAKKAGKVRYIGFTGHRSPQLHLQMLEQDYEWDAVLMPTNILDAHYKSFQNAVLPVLNQRNIGCLGMKALVVGRLVTELGLDPALCRRYALSLPISTLLCGMQNWENIHQDIKMARNFRKLTAEETQKLVAAAVEPAKDGKLEPYKIDRAGCDWQHQRDMA